MTVAARFETEATAAAATTYIGARGLITRGYQSDRHGFRTGLGAWGRREGEDGVWKPDAGADASKRQAMGAAVVRR